MINIGSRREVFFDNFLINEKKTTAEQRIHHPVRKGIALSHDEKWEGNHCLFSSVFFADGKWKFYYRSGSGEPGHSTYISYAESLDGISWYKPNLGLVDIDGSTQNNAVLDSVSIQKWGAKHCNDCYVFYDTNPACPPEQKYKAVMSTGGDDTLISLVSPDGFHFEYFGLMTDKGAFDSLNLAFWSEEHGKYFCYFRWEHIPNGEANSDEYSYLQPTADKLWDWDSWSTRPAGPEDEPAKMMRDVHVMESPDFIHWTKSQLIGLKDDRVQLYTSIVSPYPRAPHVFVAFPTRYHERKEWTPNYDQLCGRDDRLRRIKRQYARSGLVITDGLFMCSRDGYNFERYDEAFLPPPVEHRYSWVYGDCYFTAGLIETRSDIPWADNEYSLFVGENYGCSKGYDVLVRYTIRLDGFVSRHSGDTEKLLVTKDFIYDGNDLYANLATSAKGHAYFTLRCGDEEYRSYEIFGNSVDKKISFKDPEAVKKLSGKPVILEVELLDADIYAIRFGE